MQITLDQELVKSVVSEAILKSLDDQKREAMIQGAIKHLITPSSDRYGYGQKLTPVEEAFREAVRTVCAKLAQDLIENNEDVKTRIRDLLTESMERVLTSNREVTIARVSNALIDGMAYKRD